MKTNKPKEKIPIFTHGGAEAQHMPPFLELRRTVMNCLLFEDQHYEKGDKTALRIVELCRQVRAAEIATLAVEARERMRLRHVPLFLCVQLLEHRGAAERAETIAKCVKRPDEAAELIALYWQHGKKKLPRALRTGLRRAFRHWDEYQLAKWSGTKDAIKLRDVMMLVHPKPLPMGIEEPVIVTTPRRRRRHVTGQAAVFKRLYEKQLATPDTWEAALTAGKDKKETFERLLREKKLPGMATLMNLRNMMQANVDLALIRERLAAGLGMALPFRFLAAAREVPQLEAEIDQAMLCSVARLPKFPGKSLILVDVSGSMATAIARRGRSGDVGLPRLEIACGIAILAREMCDDTEVWATAGNDTKRVHDTRLLPSRRGMALRDVIFHAASTQGGGGIFTAQAIEHIQKTGAAFDRVFVFSDSQDCDLNRTPMSALRLGKRGNYIMNVGAYQAAYGMGGGWHNIDGFSERVLEWVWEIENDAASANH